MVALRNRLARAPVLAAAVTAAGAFAIALTVQRSSPGSFDFVALYASARLVATGQGALVTDPTAILAMEHAAVPERTILLNNPNPPALSLILAPLGLLPFDVAYVVMLALATLAMTVAVLLLAPLAEPGSRGRLLPFALLGPPTLIALVQGQTTPFVLCAIAASLRTRPLLGGLLLSATALRPQLLPLYLVAAASEGRRLGGFALGTLAVAAVSVAVAGPQGIARYPDLLRYAAAEGGRNELGAGTLLRRAGMPGDPVAVDLAASAVVLAIGAIVVGRLPVTPRHNREELQVRPEARPKDGPAKTDRTVAAGPWALVGAPHALLHDVVFAYPSVAATRGIATAVWVASGTVAAIAHEAGVPLLVPWLLALGLQPALTRWRA